MHKKNITKKGKLISHHIDSVFLQNNAMGDSSERTVVVYLPHGYDSSRHYPLMVEYAAYANSGLGRLSWKNFGENVPERLDRLIQEGMPPAIVVFPDCFTRLGGNQYINSYLGNYADFIIHEVVPHVEAAYATGGTGHRACYGKSSGGYGAMVHGMLYPHFWSAIGCLSGDMGFDLLFTPLLPRALSVLAGYDQSVQAFVEKFESGDNPQWSDIECLGVLCAAASFDPDPSQFLGIRLPIDPYSGNFSEERWQRWLSFDPVRMVERHGNDLKKLKKIYFDCGNKDQFNLHFGARRLHLLMEEKEIPHTFDEFEGGHLGLDYRLDACFKTLLEAMKR